MTVAQIILAKTGQLDQIQTKYTGEMRKLSREELEHCIEHLYAEITVLHLTNSALAGIALYGLTHLVEVLREKLQ